MGKDEHNNSKGNNFLAQTPKSQIVDGKMLSSPRSLLITKIKKHKQEAAQQKNELKKNKVVISKAIQFE